MKKTKISNTTILELYEKMCESRRFDEEVEYLLTVGRITGSSHSSIGQEASGACASYAMDESDYKLYSHRCHSNCIGPRGIDINKVMAEMMGRETGLCKGRGGSMHLADMAIGVLGANGIVGGGIPISLGAGLAIKKKKLKRAVLCCFGDGASNQGTFHESLNLAATWKLPIIFYCENNYFAISTKISDVTNTPGLAVRAKAYGMESKTIDGYNAIEVYETIREAREYVMENGPILIVADTFRWKGHNIADANTPYRTKEEVEEWKKKCPIKTLKNYILENKIATEEELARIDKRVDEAIANAIQFAENSPVPSIDHILDDVYV